jgi:hypothetical protein
MTKLERLICKRIVYVLNDTCTSHHYSYTVGTISKRPVLHASNSRGSKSVQLAETVHNYKVWIKHPETALTPIPDVLLTGPDQKEMKVLQKDFLLYGWTP